MRRDVTNPNRVVPDPNIWRDRRPAPGPFRSSSELRYARNEMAEWHGTYVIEAERFRLSDRAMKLYEVLCGIALSRRSVGRLDLTYAQLQRRLGVAEVEIVEDDGSAAIDEWGAPVRVLDPDWGQGIRTLQRTLRELAAAEFVSIGYVSNRDCGGHRLCLQLSAPAWFLAKVQTAADLGRAKGGRISRPRAPTTPTQPARPRPGPRRSCPKCDGLGVVERPDGLCEPCDHAPDAQARAGP